MICIHLGEDAALPEAGLVLVEHHGDGVELLLGERGEEHAAPHRARQTLHGLLLLQRILSIRVVNGNSRNVQCPEK